MAGISSPVTSTSTTKNSPSTWVIVGASRGIGLEFVRQLLARGDQVIAAVRDPGTASQLWQLAADGGPQTGLRRPGSCVIEKCDVTSEEDILAFADSLRVLLEKGMRVDNVVLNAGVLKYPNRATELSYNDFALHLHTNTIGPIICAQKILSAIQSVPNCPSPGKVIFISSDSGSTGLFREDEDGFGAYAASKAALNQMLRHMAAEIRRKEENEEKPRERPAGDGGGAPGEHGGVCVLAIHPGEVATDMANLELDWDVEGIIQPDESVGKMLKVIESKTAKDSGTFWCWDGRPHPW